MPSDKINRRKSDLQQEPKKRRKSLAKKSTENITTLFTNDAIILPTAFINCDKTELIIIISRMLTSIVQINDQRTSLDVKYLNSAHLTRFHSRSPPQISIFNYLQRLSHYSSLENCVLIATVYYIDLLTIKYPLFALNSLTVHRFLLTATTIASKALCDSFCSNSHYAKVGGVNIIELNLLETEFLKWVNYRVIPRDFNYDSVCERKSSSSNLETAEINSLKFGISTANKILDLYYEKMITLMGKRNENNKESIMIGHNDCLVYLLEDLNPARNNQRNSITSSNSSLDSENSENDEIDDRYPEVSSSNTDQGKIGSHLTEKQRQRQQLQSQFSQVPSPNSTYQTTNQHTSSSIQVTQIPVSVAVPPQPPIPPVNADFSPAPDKT